MNEVKECIERKRTALEEEVTNLHHCIDLINDVISRVAVCLDNTRGAKPVDDGPKTANVLSAGGKIGELHDANNILTEKVNTLLNLVSELEDYI